MSGSITNVNNLDFNTTPPQSLSSTIEGRLSWDNGTRDLIVGAGNNVDIHVGQQEWAYVYNAEATTLNKGEIVFISGSQGNTIAVKRASDSGDSTSAGTLGMVGESIASGAEGLVLVNGLMRKLDTSTLTAGKLVYLSSTPGGYTLTPPTPPSHSVRIGYVAKVDNNQGEIYIKVDNGYEIGELHDIIDGTTTTSYGDLLVKSGSVWKNSKQLTGSYGLTGSLQATSFTGSIQGSASYAIQSLSSSFAISASFASSSPAVYDFGSFETPTDVGGGGNFGIVTDGDKGDITVTSSGSIWTVDNDAVTYAKIQNVTTSSVLLGRATAGAGDIEEIILGSGLSLLGTTLSAADGGGGAQVQVDVITGSGTWNKPAFAQKISVYLLPGGGGGGSGARRATTSNRCGGAGGSACGYISAVFNATAISSSVSVTIGAGGATGSSVTSDDTNGNDGGVGGATSFGSFLATGTNGYGRGGTTSTSVSAIDGFGAAGFLVNTTNITGRSGTTTTGTSFLSSGLGFNTSLCGGGGAGAAANITTTANGGQVTSSNWTTIFPQVTFGTPGTDGGSGGNGSSIPIGNILYLNTGGGGGSYKTGQATGAGGDGGYGAGGGGGAASDNGFASGAGGRGGDGLCIVISEG